MKSTVSSFKQDLNSQRDNLLIKETLKGNDQSFAKLIAQYQPKIKALGMSFFHNIFDVEDFEQEVYIKVFKNLANFRGESKFSTWMIRIAYTTALNAKNRRVDYESIADDEIIPSNHLTPEEEILDSFTKEAVRESLKLLPNNYAICLDLFFFYDLSLEEIQVITGFPVNTIKSHIFRAKKILAEKLIDYGHKM